MQPKQDTSRTQQGQLKFKRRKGAVAKLPYVGADHHSGCSMWDVPSTGDYWGGWDTGQALALVALKHVKSHHDYPAGHLGHIAASWLERAQQAAPEEFATLRGQVLGFMRTVEVAAIGGLFHAGYDTDSWDEKSLLKEANKGLAFKAPPEWKN
ncbi:hypothetical protein ACX3YG_19635 [Pseudomonas wadenswilerensis]